MDVEATLPPSPLDNFCASAKHNSSPNTYSIDSAAMISNNEDCGAALAAERAAAEKETKRLAELALANGVARNAGYKDAEEYEECFTNVLATNIELYENYEACRFNSESSFTVGHSSSCSQPLFEAVRIRYGGIGRNFSRNANNKCRRESDTNLVHRLMNTYTYRNCTDEKSRAYCVCIIRAHNKQTSLSQVIAQCNRLSRSAPTEDYPNLNQQLLHGFAVNKQRAETGAMLHFDTRPCVMLSTDETRCPHEQKCKGFAQYSRMCK
jgi:hypothetical protein